MRLRSGAGAGASPDGDAAVSEADADFTSDSDFRLSEEDSATTEDDDAASAAGDDDAAAAADPFPPIVAREAVVLPVPARKKRRARKREREGRRGSRDDPLLWEVWEAENEAWIDKQQVESGGDAVSSSGAVAVAATVDPPEDVILPLLRFQKEWLAWALAQERTDLRGGILADEMGMGKTIQAISLVLAARSLRNSVGSAASSSSPLPSTSQPQLPEVGCTLVICPVVAVIQWAGEIERYTKKGSARVLLYHGPNRSKVEHDFNDYDFVLTTYSIVESEFRRHCMPPKQKCEYCGKLLYPKKMVIHLRYFCGPNAKKTAKQSKQQSKKQKAVTLTTAEHTFEMGSGSSEEDGKLKGKGKKKKTQPQSKKSKDQEDEPSFVLDAPSKGKSLLHSVRWERIILDEAHFIKDRRCNTAKAVFSIDSSYRWCLSGTPLQNRVGELYSLVHFLRMHPYSFYFCKDCDCKVLDFGISTDRRCVSCPHSTSRHFCWWNRYITNPMLSGSGGYEGKRAMILLKDKVLKSVVLRRTKLGRAADLALPPRLVTLRKDSLDKNETEFYEAMYTQSCVQFDTYVAAGTLMNNYAHIFDLLTRLRQAVDHPYLVIYSSTATPSECNDSTKNSCGICRDPAEDVVVTACEHVFCRGCLVDYSSALGDVLCPSCSNPLTVDLTTKGSNAGIVPKRVLKGILNRVDVSEFKTSTKIDALREEIRNMVEDDRSAKGIVFSQFTSFLDLINFSLHQSGVKCVQLVGSMNLAEREKAIDSFTNDPDCRIFLMSLKAGGVALNLTVASHVFLMDPWWNPAVERQAQDRIHRIGQYKPIKSVRFVIENTVEERILRLQDRKQLLFEGTVGDSKEAMAKLTEADLRFLFQI